MVSNATAGTNEAEAIQAATDVLERCFDVELVATADPDELRACLEKLDGRNLTVAGGDGSLHAVMNALLFLDLLRTVRLGLIPLGTGNDFARGVGIPLDPAEAARMITTRETSAVDLIVDGMDRVVVNNAHLGVGADASREAEKWKPKLGAVKLGRLAYAVGALRAGLRPEFIRANVTVDGEAIAPPCNIAQVAIGNGSQVGGGTELIPGADVVSRKLVVILSREVGPWRRLAYLARLRGGSHHLMREVLRVTGTCCRVEGEEFYLSADGEITGPHTSISFELRPGAVEMFLPRVAATD